jgi:lipoate-protein ligase A
MKTAVSAERTELFDHLVIINDRGFRSAAMNMAIDEALLETADVASIRFYRWDHPALSFGYFGRFADAKSFGIERDLVRRWTGGGIVLHGKDLTYSLVIPASDSAFNESSMSIYENVHKALCDALVAAGQQAVVAAIADRGASHTDGTGISDAGSSCFANPVRADVLLNGRKIAGAAQRCTRRGLLQQGSIQNIDLANDFEQMFAHELSANFTPSEIETPVLDRAEMIAEQKYATAAWLQKR